MYEVIGTRASRAIRVLWMLEEIGQPYTHTPCAPRSAEALEVNPTGKVPALRTDGQILTDSVAIMTFLGDRHGALTHPSGSMARARQDALTFQILDEVDSLLWTAARHSFLLPKDRRVPAVKDTLKWEFERNISWLAKSLSGPFLMGDEMLIPDLLLAHCLGWAETAKFPNPPDTLADYLSRLRARPAFQRVKALP